MGREFYTGSTEQDLKVLIDDLTGKINFNPLPGCELSDIDSLQYFFDKYKSSLERGKPNQRAANNLKNYIDVIQVNNMEVKLIGAFKNRKL